MSAADEVREFMSAIHAKRADTPEGVARLRREAETIRRVAGPGIVELAGEDLNDRNGALHLRLVEGLTFNNANFTADQLVVAMRDLASAVKRLHDQFLVHGRITPDHVLVPIRTRRPVLTGLAEAHEAKRGSTEFAEDVAALGRLLESKLSGVLDNPGDSKDSTSQERAHRRDATLRRLVELTAVPDHRRRIDVDRFLEVLDGIDHGAAVPEAPLPLPVRWSRPAEQRDDTGGRILAVFIASSVALIAAVVLVMRVAGSEQPQVAGTVVCPSLAADRPSADIDGDGCPESVLIEGTTVRAGTEVFTVGGPGDRLFLGRWACGGTPTLALFRPADGSIYAFDRWPTRGQGATPRFVAAMPGATGATVVADGDCDTLRVDTTDSSTIVRPDVTVPR